MLHAILMLNEKFHKEKNEPLIHFQVDEKNLHHEGYCSKFI